jgi:hypothetical protein
MLMMKQVAAIGAIGVFSTCLFAQGLTSSQTKDQWEEINFEFNSSILSDGYPSLLRLAEMLGQHRDYHVKLVGNTDYVGSARYNDRLAMRRAETVRDFLVKYGAGADQIITAGDGKKDPEVDNKTKEGRFMNRRVILTVTDGQGKIVAAGGASDIMPILQELLKKQEECCNNILKRLDKLDEILAALRDLKGENDRLKGQVAELQGQEKALEDKVNGLPKPLSKEQTTIIAEKAGTDAVDEAQKRNKKFSLLGLDIGPTLGNRPSGDVTIQGSGQFFSPFGGDGTHAVQAQAEYMRYPGRQEGQFDIGLVNRWDHLQAGLFSSFKYIRFSEYENGGSMGQGAFLLDYLFSRGRIGLYATEGFKNTGALTETPLGLTSFMETYARPMNQFGANVQVGAWGDAWIQGNFGYIHSHSSNPNRPGGEIKLVQPFSKDFAFTVRAGLNPTLLTAKNTGELTFGLEFGNFMRPKEYTTFSHPVPMDVPRIRYELLTRQVGHSAPVADAGPNQFVPPGTVTLNGSGSYSPDHDGLNYSWSQISGPSVALSGANAAIATFTAVGSTSYAFRLTVTDQVDGLSASASTSVTTQRALQVVRFSATPSQIASGQSSTLAWNVTNATSVNISGVGSGLNPQGNATVSPTVTTTYNLTATGPGGQSITASVTVTVGASKPTIVRFGASPTHINQGQSSLLSWTTTGAQTVTIDNGVGAVPVNGSKSVSPATSTTYTLTATGADGVTTVTAAVTVTVGGGAAPTVLSFTASPTVIVAGGQSSLCWNVTNAQTVNIVPGLSNQPLVGCATVTPTATTTYVLTATNAVGPTQAVVTVSVGAVQILTFSANPAYSPASGAPVVLSWTTQNATSVNITGTGVPGGTQSTNGSLTVNPTTNSDYTLTAYGPGGPVSSVIHVFVR